LSDCTFKADKALEKIKLVDEEKPGSKEIIPKIAKLERDLANINVKINRNANFL